MKTALRGARTSHGRSDLSQESLVRAARRIFAGVVLGTLILGAVPTVAAADGPLRSGSMVGGYVILTAPPPCIFTPDCAAWLLAGCDPRLAGRDPGVFSSIVDVHEFERTERTLRLSSIWLAGYVDFWSDDCRQLRSFVPWDEELHLRIPADTGWMSITAGTPVLSWELW